MASGPALPPGGLSARLRTAAGLLAVAAVATPFAGIFVLERQVVDAEIALVAPEEAAPGDAVPLRALLYDGLETPSGAQLRRREVAVTLTGPGSVHVASTLRPAPARGAEGLLRLPVELPEGGYVLRASAPGFSAVERPLAVRAELPERTAAPRALGPLTALRVGTLPDGPPAPELRVVSGACVPESPCEVLVDPAETRTVAIAPSSSIRVEGTGTVVVHGAEGATDLRYGEASASLQLPVLLGTPALRVDDRFGADPRPILETDVLTEGRAVVLDAFHDGRWARTRSFMGGTPYRWDGVPLEAGRWLLQARTSLYDQSRVLSLELLVGGDGDDRAWEAAAREARVYALPEPVSSLEGDREALRQRKERMRQASLLAVVMALLLAAVAFGRRAIQSTAVTRRVLEASRDATGDPALSERRRLALLLDAFGVALLALLGLLAGAALLLVRAYAP